MRFQMGVVLLAMLVSGAAQAAWTLEVKTSPMDGKQTLYLQAVAKERVRDRFGRFSTASIALRCSAGSVAVYFDAGTILEGYGQNVRTRLRFDEAEPEIAEGTRSTDYEAVFYEYGEHWAKKLLGARSLLVEFTPFQATAQVVKVDVSNLQRFRSEIDKHCQLKSE